MSEEEFNIEDDPRFMKLDQKWIDEIATYPETGEDWHEVVFDIGRMTCQVAVVKGEYVVKGAFQPEQIVRIVKVMPSPIPR
jgi:hypothetical protein